jgi:hypothetical protein
MSIKFSVPSTSFPAGASSVEPEGGREGFLKSEGIIFSPLVKNAKRGI